MPGPKYVKDFSFPSGFGFSASATDRTTTTVRSHERTKPRFAEGGRVRRPMSAEEKRMLSDEYRIGTSPPPPTRKEPERKLSAVEALQGKGRRLREQELGLKTGGSVAKARKAMGGPVGYAKGGDVAQDKKLIKSAIAKHVRAPKPRGHGVK